MSFLSKLKKFFTPRAKSNLPIINLEKRFELVCRTGQGSMSKVWRARDRMLGGRTVCVKVLDKVKTAKFDARFPGLKRPSEGALLMLLRHQNIVKTLEHGLTTKGEPYIIMELIEGMGLNFLIETKSPHLKGNRINFLTQIADGIQYVHRQKFLHRDICPRNIMLTHEGIAKIIDFGLSIPYQPEFCRPGNRTGTPNYMSPELIKRQTTDHRVDIFALGVTAYEVFTGSLPWEKTESLQTLLSHMNSPGRDPRDLAPGLDDATAEFLIKATNRDRTLRFQSANEFREALQSLPPC